MISPVTGAAIDRVRLATSGEIKRTLDPNNVDNALWDELRRHFDEGEVVELAAVVGLFNYFNRFNQSSAALPA